MKQVINILIKNKNISRLQKEYNPDYKKIIPHITLVYPFENVNQENLIKHIKKQLKNTKKFKITLRGFGKSAKEYYLYLLVKKGNTNLITLYKKLNSGLLKNFKKKDMPRYIPHISLGNFKTAQEINKVLLKLKNNPLKIDYLVEKITLLTLNTHKIKSKKEFRLK
jgi:2'-5' RNA ligase